MFQGRSTLKSSKNLFRARLDARNSFKWAFRKIDDFCQKVKFVKIEISAPLNFLDKSSTKAKKTHIRILRPRSTTNKILASEDNHKVHFETSSNRDFGLPGQVPTKAVLSRFWQKFPFWTVKLAQIELLMPLPCYWGKFDPETLFWANALNLKFFEPTTSQLGLGNSDPNLVKRAL